ncbi:DUF2958 domain-containing protein [Desulfatiglans anilini]|uniref:DUF2958 domain-containing protein n=1 Tax=Desulfatiglans anilini TaxID=90728 RepID=UPI0003FCC685|nr:DUF2958 domain-containing protein [Desulfatiglans anilini]
MWNTPTEEDLAKIPRLYKTEHIPLREKLIQLHFFFGDSDWYIVEYDGGDIFWGFAILGGDLMNAEWGYIPFSELKSLNIGGFLVDRDLYWEVQPAGQVYKIRQAWCHSHWEDSLPNSALACGGEIGSEKA